MSAPTLARPPAAAPPRKVEPPRTLLPWVTAVGSGVAVLLASAPVTTIVAGLGWLNHAFGAVLVVVLVGMALYRAGGIAVAAGQVAALLLYLTLQFADHRVLGVFPGGDAFRDFGALVAGAGGQIDASTAPVPSTPQILFITTTAIGVLSICVQLLAVTAKAPAAAGVPLLAVFAVPAALADTLLPWWTMVCAAAGFGLLLLVREGARRQMVGGVVLIALASVVALVAGLGTGFIGTSGRFENGAGGGSGGGGSIGLSPFTALRGQLDESKPTELLRVRGLPHATYLKALTLRDYIPNVGWQPTRPDSGPPIPGTIGADSQAASSTATVDFENVDYRDYWLPLYGDPISVQGLPSDHWEYDVRSATAYSARPRQESNWQQQAQLALPTADELRAADGSASPGPDFTRLVGVDQRVIDLSQQIVAGKDNAFDKAVALQEYFVGPDSQFTYTLKTAPGNGDDALVEFLTQGKQGYCEQFASAMAVMLRAVGVPSRVAVGFTGGTQVGDYRSVTTADAHAWVEAWFPNIGWVTFDPTPLTDGRTITPPYITQALTQGGAGSANPADDVAPKGQDRENPARQTPGGPDKDVPAPVTQTQADSSGFPVWPVVVLVLVIGIVALPRTLRTVTRRRRLAVAAAGGPDAAAAAWSELLDESADRGVLAPPSDTVRGAARRLVREHRLDTATQETLRRLVTAVETSWYGGAHPRPGELDAAVRTIGAGIATGSPLSFRERLVPRSVLRRKADRIAHAEELALAGK